MSIKRLSDTFSVSGELLEPEFEQLKDLKVAALVNVRPYNEVGNTYDETYWRKQCKNYGMKYYYLPVSPCKYSQQDVQDFTSILQSTERNIHAFCRTGARAAHLYALAKRYKYPFSHLQGLLKSRGYDLDVIAEQFC